MCVRHVEFFHNTSDNPQGNNMDVVKMRRKILGIEVIRADQFLRYNRNSNGPRTDRYSQTETSQIGFQHGQTGDFLMLVGYERLGGAGRWRMRLG